MSRLFVCHMLNKDMIVTCKWLLALCCFNKFEYKFEFELID